MCLLAENITGNAHQFPFLAFLLFFTGFLAPVGVHSGFLVPSEQHQRHVQRASVSHFQGFHYRLRGFFVLLDGKDGRRLALQFAPQMPAQLQAVGDKMQHAQDAGVVDTCQPIEFVYHRHAFRFVVGTLYEVGDAVNDDQLDAVVLVIELVHALHDGVQAFLSGHPRQAEGFQFVRLAGQLCPCQQVAHVLEQLHFRLFGVIKQDRLAPSVGRYVDAERVYLHIHRAYAARHDGGYIVALARSLAARDAEQVALRTQRDIARRDNHLRFGRRVVEVYLARFKHDECVAIQVV